MAVNPYAAAFLTWLSRRAGVAFPEVGDGAGGGCCMVCQIVPLEEEDIDSGGPPPYASRLPGVGPEESSELTATS